MIDNKVFIPLIIVLVGLCIFILTIVMLKRQPKKKKNSIKSTNLSLELNQHYCSEAEMKFLEALHKALPRDFIAFPYVGVDNIVNPIGDKNMYNKILSKYVDVCVFLRRTMTPVLAIDLFNSNPIVQALKKMDRDVYDALKCAKLPIVEIRMAETYDLNILKKNIIDNLPNNVYLLIKDQNK